MSQLQYMRPIERGYVTDAFVQTTIWERLLGPHMLNMAADGGLGAAGASAASRRGAGAAAAASGVSRRDVRDTPLVLTAAPFMPQSVEVRPAVCPCPFPSLPCRALRAMTAKRTPLLLSRTHGARGCMRWWLIIR